MVAIVLILSVEYQNFEYWARKYRYNICQTSAMLFISIVLNKLLILFLFGSRANKNPGIPIVNMLTKEIWKQACEAAHEN